MLIYITEDQYNSLHKVKVAIEYLDSFRDAENPGPTDDEPVMIGDLNQYELTYEVNGEAIRLQLGVLSDIATINLEEV